MRDPSMRAAILSVVTLPLAAAVIALLAWMEFMPRVPLQPAGLRGLVYPFTGARHATWNGIAIDAPGDYRIHIQPVVAGRPSLVISERKYPWDRPDVWHYGLAVLFVPSDTAAHRTDTAAACSATSRWPCRVEHTPDGVVRCFLRAPPPDTMTDTPPLSVGTCMSTHSAVEARFSEPRSRAAPLLRAIEVALDGRPEDVSRGAGR